MVEMTGNLPSHTGIDGSGEGTLVGSPNDRFNLNQQVNITSLQQLPEEILNLIVEFVHQADLKDFCLISKFFCWPALKRLYRNITLLHQWYCTNPEIQMHIPNNCTILTLKNRERFLTTVSNNKKIAALVESLTIIELPYDTDIPDVVHVIDLEWYVFQLVSRLRLDSFHCMEHFDAPIPQQAIETVQIMTCYMYGVIPLSSNLVELKITCDFNFDFEELALEMIDQGSYRKLKKLAFEICHDSEDDQDDELPVAFPAPCRPYWAQFFLTFSEEGIKLNLSGLGIDGEFRDDLNDPTADIVGSVVQLSELETLQIEYSKYIRTHGAQPHGDGPHAFLAAITSKTSSLQDLSIVHSRLCSDGDINALARVLRENIPNQLQHFRLRFAQKVEAKLAQKAEFLSRTILECQQNLVKLKLEPNIFWCSRSVRLLIGVPCLLEMNSEQGNVITSRDILSPSILNLGKCRPFIAGELFNGVISHKEMIREFLESDLIYSNAPTCLPYLTEYYVMGLYISVKQRGIFANERVISLEE